MAELSFQHAFVPGARERALLLLHGTGADERDLLPIGRAVAPERALVSPLGRVREHGMPRWFRRLAEGVFDEEDLRRRVDELAPFLDEAAAAYALDRASMGALGFSNGANMIAALLLLRGPVVREAVLLRAMLPLEPERLPDLRGVRVLIASGTHDPMMPRASAERLAALLRDAGADVTHRFVPGAHGLLPDEVPQVRAWLAQAEPRASR